MKTLFPVCTRGNLAVSLVLAISMVGVSYGAGGNLPGDGLSESTAYLIEDLADFDEFAGNSSYWSSGVYTKLACDPNLTGRTYITAVIAQRGSGHFEGVFDGNGHIIYNLTIDTNGADTSDLGLFGSIEGSSAEIRNLGLENVNVIGGDDSDNIGGLCGIYFCGSNTIGSIHNCYTTGSLVGGNSSHSIGGVFGRSLSGNIFNCYSTCTVSGGDDSNYLGGLCGFNSSGSISNCYATGSVTGNDRLGGLCGGNFRASINNCYSTGTVTGGIGASYVGGFCGLSNGSILNCYFLNTAGPNNGLAMSLTHYAMKQQSSFSNWDFVGEAVNGTSSTWSIKPETYPSLHYFDPTFVLYEFTGQGTKQDPYRICEPNDLGAIWQQPGCYYQLQNDIDLAGITWPMAVIPTFRGMFDGNDYTLFNLNISGGSFLGLFGASRMSVLITSLSLEDVNVTGGDNSLYLGGLCSSNSGCISNCYATGSVTGGDESWFLGGLCGWNSFGSISNCYSTVSVTGGDEAYYISGLSGNYVGSIDSCYATGTVTGGNASNSVGGLCGYNAYSSISNSYSTGIVSGGTGSDYLGGLCGLSEFGTFSNCYFLDSAGTHNGLGTPLTDSEMKQQNSFTGWDFVDEPANGTSSLWIIHAGQYPSLFYFDPTFVPHVFIGQGTEPDPYRIYNTNDIGAIRQQPDSYYQLQNDIDLAGISWSVAVIPTFLGTLDGNNYSISNLNLSGGSILGLFGFLQTGASVTSLGLENANITGGVYSHSISSLCGLNNYGIISNCYSTGSITGDEFLGGICGSNYGSISNCYTAGSITGDDNLGGLCGQNDGGAIINCYTA